MLLIIKGGIILSTLTEWELQVRLAAQFMGLADMYESVDAELHAKYSQEFDKHLKIAESIATQNN
jgi:hypothetical protein